MSGGYFCDHGYPYYRVTQFADELTNKVDNNGLSFSSETLAVLRAEIPVLRRAAEVMRAIDYLYAGDHGEDSFAKAMKEIGSP